MVGLQNRQIASAQNDLRETLESALGPGLPGITGFGAGLDNQTHEVALNVHVDGAATEHRVRSRLPRKIRGFQVKISRRGPAIFDLADNY